MLQKFEIDDRQQYWEKFMKNLVFNGIHNSVDGELLQDLCDNFKLESVTAVTFNESFIIDTALNCGNLEQLNFYKIVYGIYPDSTHSVIDQEVMDRISPYLFSILKMMDRLPPNLVYGFEDRMKMLFEHVRYWDNLLIEKKVDMFISTNYPHQIFDYIAYALCKSRGIKTLFFTQTQLDGYVQIIQTIEDNDLRLKKPFPVQVNKSGLPELVEQQFNNLTSEEPAAPFYMKENVEILRKKRQINFNLFKYGQELYRLFMQHMYSDKKFSRRVIDKLFYRKISGSAAEKKLRRSYKQLSCEPNYMEQYIYVPLHFQPECTTSPQGGVFVYQELMISILAKNMPANSKLYVKEHPVQEIHGRDLAFYNRLISLPNVKLIKLEINSNDLIDNCVAVATITGTAAWEALFKEKPVLLFGDIWFKYTPGVFSIKTNDDCKTAVSTIFDINFISQTRSQLRTYLANIQPYLVRGYSDPLYGNVSKIRSEENRENLANAMILAVKRCAGE
mgnify:CR=1 FL=1